MSRVSVKQRLIDALEKELAEQPGDFTLERQLRFLRNRGSGPLPSWLRTVAEARGIT